MFDLGVRSLQDTSVCVKCVPNSMCKRFSKSYFLWDQKSSPNNFAQKSVQKHTQKTQKKRENNSEKSSKKCRFAF